MKAVLKFFVWIIVLVLVLIVIVAALGVYEFVQIGQNKDDLLKVQNLTLALCKKEDPDCIKRVAVKYGPCLAPMLKADERTACFDGAYAQALAEFHPELGKATMSNDQIENWASKAAQEALTFDATNVQERLKAAQGYFTMDGWNSYTKALTDSNMVSNVNTNKIGVILTIDGPATLKQGQVENGIYTWEIGLPSTIHFTGPDAVKPAPMKVAIVLKITRSPFANNVDGIGIKQWVTRLEH